MADIDLQDVHDTLLAIAFEAARMIMSANPNDISQDTKLNCMKVHSARPQARSSCRRRDLT